MCCYLVVVVWVEECWSGDGFDFVVNLLLCVVVECLLCYCVVDDFGDDESGEKFGYCFYYWFG